MSQMWPKGHEVGLTLASWCVFETWPKCYQLAWMWISASVTRVRWGPKKMLTWEISSGFMSGFRKPHWVWLSVDIQRQIWTKEILQERFSCLGQTLFVMGENYLPASQEFSSLFPSIHPSIHLLTSVYLISGWGGSSLSQEAQTSLSSSYSVIPKPAKRYDRIAWGHGEGCPSSYSDRIARWQNKDIAWQNSLMTE